MIGPRPRRRDFMKEGPPQFGEPFKKQDRAQQHPMFPDGDDLPLFSGTPPVVNDSPYLPEDRSVRQGLLPGMPGIDLDHIYELDKERRAKRRH